LTLLSNQTESPGHLKKGQFVTQAVVFPITKSANGQSFFGKSAAKRVVMSQMVSPGWNV
jgi:hypothetical protein